MTDVRYFEDLSVGDEWDAGVATITEAELLAFAERYDPQAFHTDEQAADRHFGGLIASGWHTAAACMRPFVDAVLADLAVVAAIGIDDLRWHAPVRPEDELSVRVCVVGRDGWDETRGRVSFELLARNQDGQLVHSRTDRVLVERRAAGKTAAGKSAQST